MWSVIGQELVAQPMWGPVIVLVIVGVVLLGQAWIASAVRAERRRRAGPLSERRPSYKRRKRRSDDERNARRVVRAHYAHEARQRRRDRIALAGYDPEVHGYHEGRRWRR